jgi:Fe-S cluster assembly iron-binding protein IscA
MINVTDKAAEVLHRSLEENEESDDDMFRIEMTDEGIGLALGAEREGDQLIQHDQRAVLAIEHDLAQALDGASIDAVETPDGTRLVFESPEG